MAGNDANFCTAIREYETHPPKLHLVLRMRAHPLAGFTLQGERAEEIGAHFAEARDAMRAVRRFVR